MNIAIKILEEQVQARELSYQKNVIYGSVKKTSQVAMLNRLHVRQLNDAIDIILKNHKSVEVRVVNKKLTKKILECSDPKTILKELVQFYNSHEGIMISPTLQNELKICREEINEILRLYPELGKVHLNVYYI